MNKNISSLISIAAKKERFIIGLMSGTSLDGLDIALCKFEGVGTDTKVDVREFTTINYTASFSTEIKKVFSKKSVELEQVCLLNAWIGSQHAAMINAALHKWGVHNSMVDLIASHGQTIFHAPQKQHGHSLFGNATLQIGDGDHIAVKTGIITVSDFRQKHIAAGGEGAPLAVYGDYLLFGKRGENRVMLNIGGIANYTFLPDDGDTAKMYSTDTGPGNTLMDAYIQKHFEGMQYDKNGQIAQQGKVHEGLLQALKQNNFFEKPVPKTTGPELFNLAYVEQAKEQAAAVNMSHADTMATLNRFTADTIVAPLKNTFGNQSFIIYPSGGGIHNLLLMQHIQNQLPNAKFENIQTLHVHPDAKEAVLFATLANECIAGDGTNFTNGIPNVTMGKISFPW